MSRPLRSLVVTLLLLAGFTSAQEPGADLGRRVQAIFKERCAECHGAELVRPKGRFGDVEDLEKVAKRYVTKGDVDESELWWYLSGEQELMPPKKQGGPLSTDELAVIRWWILAGAPPGDPPGKTTKAAPDPEADSFVAPFHVVLVHFPIALVIVALFAESLFFFVRNEAMRTAAGLCLVLGAISTFAAAYSGWALGETFVEEEVFNHRWTGVGALGTSIGAAVCLALGRSGKRTWAIWAYRLLLLAAAALVGIAGHLGGILVHGPDHLPL